MTTLARITLTPLSWLLVTLWLMLLVEKPLLWTFATCFGLLAGYAWVKRDELKHPYSFLE